MGVITKENIDPEHLKLLLFYFNEYKKSFEMIKREDINKLNFIQRKKFNKVKEEVFKFYEVLDNY
jgi:hypothetical protein